MRLNIIETDWKSLNKWKVNVEWLRNYEKVEWS